MDELDKKIIKYLTKDGRLNNKTIAEYLNVSEGTIRNRIKKLLKDNILKVTGFVNPEAIPEKQLVCLGVKLAVTKDLKKKAEELSRLKEVQSVYITAGQYDVILELWIDTKFGLINFISETLAKIDGIVSTESFVVMKSYKKWISLIDLEES